MKTRDTLARVNIDFDSYNAWGSAMGALFDIAHAIEHYGRDYVPAGWQYRDSPFCTGLDKHPSGKNDIARTIAAAILRHPDFEHALVHAGHVLDRYTSILRAQGRVY